MKKLKMLLLADLHYIGVADHVCKIPSRKGNIALELIDKIMKSLESTDIDLIVLLGDLVDNGNADGAKEDIIQIRERLLEYGIDVLVVPGNHDGPKDEMLNIFNNHQGLHKIHGYQIMTFADLYDEKDNATRDFDIMEEAFLGADKDKPIIVFQHNPIYPKIDREYPYNLGDADKIMEYYTEHNVLFSISGHAHWGIPLAKYDNVGYITCPALCEEPHRYTVLTLKGHKYNIKEGSVL